MWMTGKTPPSIGSGVGASHGEQKDFREWGMSALNKIMGLVRNIAKNKKQYYSAVSRFNDRSDKRSQKSRARYNKHKSRIDDRISRIDDRIAQYWRI